MPFIRVQITAPHSNGLPRDAITNSFAITPTGAASRTDAASAFTTEAQAFYSAIGSVLSDEYQWDAMIAEYVDLEDNQPRIPFQTDSLGATGVTGSPNRMPAELALVCSLEGARVSGANMRRRRGRFYVGPFNLATDNYGRPPSTLVSGLAVALDALITNATYTLCVYSRYTHHGVPIGRNIGETEENGAPTFPEDEGQLPDAFTPVVRAWVDDAWDTQRRRGLGPTARTVVTV